jgi:hypothetical protein
MTQQQVFENKRPLWRVYRQNQARTTQLPVSGDCLLKFDTAEISETDNQILSNLEICENRRITYISV